MLADCDRCALRDIACAECVITVLPDGQAGLGDAERRALRALAAAGMVPPLRFRPGRPAAAGRPGQPAAAGRPGQAAPAAAAQPLDLVAGPACSTGPSGPVTGARPGPRRPAARRTTGRTAGRSVRQPVPSHR